jgi:nucleotide-binding universal stress UspA family protein
MSSGTPPFSPSFPIRRIAVAISFSPYCQSVLSEAKHLADVLGASLLPIHVGEKTADKELEVLEMIKELKIDADLSTVTWDEGKEVKVILDFCDENNVDLLVLGAKVKENMLKFYIGSVARKISRKTKCSVLLVTDPSASPQEYNRIVINGVDDIKTENTIDTALYFAEHLNTKEAYIVQELDISLSLNAQVHSLKQKKELQTNDLLINTAIKKHQGKNLQIISKVAKGKNGYAISKFAQTKKADLLVISAPETQLNVVDRIFTHDMEYILAHLPCNLLIVHQRVKE